MAIYRGTGGSGDSTQDSTLNEITQQAINAADSATAASNSASNASTSAGQSSTSATNASNAATQSALSATGSSSSKDTSVAQATVATTKASEAATSATNSAASASTASTQATNSANSATASASSASTASTKADLATTNGAAQVALATAQVTLATAQASTATTKASEAATSATNAATSNTNSGNSATASANSATAAASSASGASTSASTATTKASEASTSASNAASSLATFTGQYVSQSSAPSSPSTGDLWFDTSAAIMKVYNGSGWVSAGSSVSGVENSVQYTATSNQTSFNATYDAGYLQVYLNGIRLDAEDYTATNGSTVVLDTGATVNDVVFIHSFGTFELADHYNKVASDARYEPIDSAYTKAEADANLAALVDSSPAALNTLNELAAALGDDANFSTTVTNSIATKLPLAGGTMTGDTFHGDNVAARFGAGNDLSINHNGSYSSIVDSGTGDLWIGADARIYLANAALNEVTADFNRNGAVQLYHDNAVKIATKSTGVAVTGNVEVNFIKSNPNNVLTFKLSDDTTVGSFSNTTGALILPLGVAVGGTGAANTLDDFETGTWTPILRGNTPAPSGQSYARQNGRYTKVGRLVTLEFDVELSAKGTVGGTYLIISGVPFSADMAHASGVSGVYFSSMGISCTSVVATCQRNDQIFLWVTTAAQTTLTRTNPATSYLTDTTRFVGSLTFSTS